MVIEIAEQQWQVHRVESNHPGLYVENTARRGACWCGKAEIYLSTELEGDQAVRVIMHELTHAYIYSTQAVQPENWAEEDVCELFAIYARPASILCQMICQRLFPEVALRSWTPTQKEVQA